MLQDIAAVATALAVIVAVWQLWESRRVAKSQFEDGLNAQYRGLLSELPLDALLGKPLSSADLNASMTVFYRYFDLSNEQAYLHAQKRISRSTWANWREGSQGNNLRSGSRTAYTYFSERSN